MKFSIEVDIEWIDEENNLSDEVNERLIKELSKSMLIKFSESATKQIVSTAENLIKAKTELVINSILEKPITISEGWNKNTTYESIFDMVEEQMTALYKGKILSANNSCDVDPLLKNIKIHIDRQVSSLLATVEKKIEVYSKAQANESVRDNAFVKKIESIIDSKEGQ